MRERIGCLGVQKIECAKQELFGHRAMYRTGTGDTMFQVT
jgi:hypothetical protein